jgi:cytoskeletal protein CcmA (bactofilin family)
LNEGAANNYLLFWAQANGVASASPVLIGQKRKFILSAMWKPNQSEPVRSMPNPEPQAVPVHSVPAAEPAARPATPAGDQAVISKGVFVKGEISGTESMFIDGKVEGSISLPGNRVTVGRNGQVSANVTARELIVMGKVRGNVSASDRVDIRAEGALNGDVSAARISIEDGAFFKGGIDIRKGDGKSAQTTGGSMQASNASTPETARVAS